MYNIFSELLELRSKHEIFQFTSPELKTQVLSAVSQILIKVGDYIYTLIIKYYIIVNILLKYIVLHV